MTTTKMIVKPSTKRAEWANTFQRAADAVIVTGTAARRPPTAEADAEAALITAGPLR